MLVVVLPSALLGIALAWWSSHQLVERQEQQAGQLAAATAESIGSHLKSMTSVIALLSQLPLGKEQLPEFFRVAKDFSVVEGYDITLADGDGNEFLSTRLPLGAMLPQRDAMDSVHKAIISGRPHVSEVFRGPSENQYVVTVDAPVPTSVGLRILTLSVDAVSIAAVLSRTSLPKGWVMGLIDEHGVFIARSKDPDLWIGKLTKPEIVDASRRSVSGMIRNKSVEGFPILNVFNRVPGTDWTVLVDIPQNVLHGPVAGTIGVLVGLILIVTVLTAVLALMFYRRINLATAQLLNSANDPLHISEGATVRHTFAEFETVAQNLKTSATRQDQLLVERRMSEERYQTLFRSLDEGFCVIEMIYDESQTPVDWRFLEVNPAFEMQIGLSNARGKRISELALDLEPYWFEIYGKVARTGKPIRFQNEVKSLGARWFDVYAFQTGAPGDFKVAVLFKDITEAKHLEQELLKRNADLEKATAIAEKASCAKSDFLSSMSHELRTPLNAILGFAQLMESSPSPPTPSQRRSIERILAAGWHLLDLINEILDLAQIESGKFAVSREAVSLDNLMVMCQAMVEPLAKERGIDVSFPPFDELYFVDGDSIRIRQVLINLVYNAIKYNKPAGTVSVECSRTLSNSIRISVRDTGPGLAQEQLAQLFQPFNRLGRVGGAEQGTGIGLVVSKRLVELMGGVIGVESTVGVGSVFWFELNLADTTPLTICESGHAQQQAKPWPPGVTAQRIVLYVEDDPANLQLIKDLMERRPELRLISAADGHLGLEYARIHRPDVILMDLQLPGISGIEAINMLQADPSTAHIPVIALSAFALPDEIVRALDAGFFNYLTKPIKLDELMAALDLALEYSQTKSSV